jgi:hypothetical protein
MCACMFVCGFSLLDAVCSEGQALSDGNEV